MIRFGIVFALVAFLAVSFVQATEMSAEQKDAVSKLQAKGGSVMAVAANTDDLDVNLSTVGKSAGDADLALVKLLPKVQQLNLRGTAITDAGLANLEGLTTLTHLHLENTAVTDDGVAHLKGLTNLTYLNLVNTAVSDKGVGQFAGLKGLRKLYLWQTKVTDAGAAGLKKALPEVYVNRGEEMTMTTQPAAPVPDMKGKGKKAVAVPAEVKPADKKPEEKKPVDAKPAEKKADEKNAAQAFGKPINSKCPLKGEVVDPAHVVVFEGKTIGLCCDQCEAKFKADPKKFMDKVVADVK